MFKSTPYNVGRQSLFKVMNFIGLAAIITTTSTQTYARSPRLTPQHQAVIEQFSDSDQEPSVQLVEWTNPQALKIGMIDDGSDRSGFAEYACMELRRHGVKKTVYILIADIEVLMASGNVMMLGEYRCR